MTVSLVRWAYYCGSCVLLAAAGPEPAPPAFAKSLGRGLNARDVQWLVEPALVAHHEVPVAPVLAAHHGVGKNCNVLVCAVFEDVAADLVVEERDTSKLEVAETRILEPWARFCSCLLTFPEQSDWATQHLQQGMHWLQLDDLP